LKKVQIETKIAVEFQDWIVDTIEHKKETSIPHFEETTLLPMHEERIVNLLPYNLSWIFDFR